MLNPVQGVRNFANNHPKATKVAKVAVGVGVVAGAAAAVASGKAYKALPETTREIMNKFGATKFDKLKKGFEALTSKTAESSKAFVTGALKAGKSFVNKKIANIKYHK